MEGYANFLKVPFPLTVKQQGGAHTKISISFGRMAITSAPLKKEMGKFGMDRVSIYLHIIQDGPKVGIQ
jgi:hypothetical protein